MTVYLGTYGTVELQRQSGGQALTGLKLLKNDIDTTKKRFSFNGLKHGQLVTGDRIKIVAGSALTLIPNNTEKSIENKYIHVDAVDGIRLYDSFAKAVNGTKDDAETLGTISTDLSVSVEVDNDIRVVAQLKNFELNTERETVDTTALADEFRNRISTLISGSGRISAFWEYTGNTSDEVSNYMLQLILRTKVGSNFRGRFYLKTSGYNPSKDADRANDIIYYELDGMLTSAAVQFAPDNTVEIAADFVTTGDIQLRIITEPPFRLLNQDGTLITLEQTGDAKLGIPTSNP